MLKSGVNGLAGGGAGPGRLALDQFTRLLLHAGEANGSTTPVDSSRAGHTVQGFGNANVTTAVSKFGTGSLQTSTGSQTNRFQIDHHVDFNLAARDFTIDAWVRKPNNNSGIWIAKRGLSSQFEFMAHFASNTVITVYYSITGTGSFFTLDLDVALTTDVFHHVALDRYNDTLYLYVDGILQDSAPFAVTIFTGNQPFRLHGDSFNANALVGQTDEFRWSVDIARYRGSNFIPPNHEYIGR